MVRRLILAISLVGIFSSAQAFDGTPQGFMLGGGVGVAGSFVSQDLDGSKFDDFFEPGASFDLRAGWGVSGSIFLYASARGSFIQYDTVNLIGSDTMLIAPVKVGKEAMTAAGSVISKDVPPGALSVERAEQKTVPGYFERKLKRKKARKK